MLGWSSGDLLCTLAVEGREGGGKSGADEHGELERIMGERRWRMEKMELSMTGKDAGGCRVTTWTVAMVCFGQSWGPSAVAIGLTADGHGSVDYILVELLHGLASDAGWRDVLVFF